MGGLAGCVPALDRWARSVRLGLEDLAFGWNWTVADLID